VLNEDFAVNFEAPLGDGSTVDDLFRAARHEMLSPPACPTLTDNVSRLPYSVLGERVRLASCPAEHLRTLLPGILELVFYRSISTVLSAQSVRGFFALTVFREELSMLAHVDSLRCFPTGVLRTTTGASSSRDETPAGESESVDSDEPGFCVLRIGDAPLGFEQCGVVRQFAEPLAFGGVDEVVYMSTFDSDFLFVSHEDLGLVSEILSTR
jgi:hypothetical protein